MSSSFCKKEVINIRVLVLTTTFPRWKDDATPALVYELSKRLQEDGFDIVVLAPHHAGTKRFETVDGMKVYRFPYFYPTKYQRLVYEGGILPNLKRSNLAKIQVPLLVLSELFYAFKIIRKEKIDVVHSHWIIPSGLVGGIVRKIFGKPHITRAHANASSFANLLLDYSTGTIEKPIINKREPLKEELVHFIECIKNGTEPLVTGSDAIKTLNVLEELVKMQGKPSNPNNKLNNKVTKM